MDAADCCPAIGTTSSGFGALEQALSREFRATEGMFNGEIVCVDPEDGRSVFAALFHHRVEPHFYAFDLLSLEGLRPAKVRPISTTHLQQTPLSFAPDAI